MKFALSIFILVAATANAKAADTACKAEVEASVQNKTQRKDPNSSVIAVRSIGNLSEKAFHNDLLSELSGYYVTTSDESGGCVWHVIVTKSCSIATAEELYCF